MELKPYNVKRILNNIEKVFSKKDITLLNKASYEFLYMMSGFIAHFNLGGFWVTYSDLRDLVKQLELSIPVEKDICQRDVDDPKHNGYGFTYCQSKLEIVEGLEKIVEKYKDEVSIEGNKIDDNRFNLLKECMERARKDLKFRKELIDKVFD